MKILQKMAIIQNRCNDLRLVAYNHQEKRKNYVSFLHFAIIMSMILDHCNSFECVNRSNGCVLYWGNLQ